MKAKIKEFSDINRRLVVVQQAVDAMKKYALVVTLRGHTLNTAEGQQNYKKLVRHLAFRQGLEPYMLL